MGHSGDAGKNCSVIAHGLDSLGRHQRHCEGQGENGGFKMISLTKTKFL